VCLSLSVCLSLAAFRHYCTDQDVTWGNGSGALYTTQQQSFYGPLSGTTLMSLYQKKHSPTHHLEGCPLVVHCWADLQSVYGFHCCDNIHVCRLIALYIANSYSAKRKMSVSASTSCMAGHRYCIISTKMGSE